MQVENTKWILCCRKIGLKCAVYKISDVQMLFYVIASKEEYFQCNNFELIHNKNTQIQMVILYQKSYSEKKEFNKY